MPVTIKEEKRKKKRRKEKRKKEERKNRPQIPTAKKERPNHKCWRQTKNGCPNQASKQLTPNETNKTAETTSKTQTVAYLQTQGGKNTTKSQQSNRLLSATNEWTTFVAAIRAQSKINCADKQMESQTNHN